MFNLNEKYFSISERCGRNHQNKFCLRPLKGRLGPWELTRHIGGPTLEFPNMLIGDPAVVHITYDTIDICYSNHLKKN